MSETSQSPFKALEAFQKGDRDRFFGRDREISQLYRAVTGSNLVLVYGASGTGKTSLVNCGLANKLLESDWYPIYVRRGRNLNRSLQRQLVRESATTLARDATVAERIRSLYLDRYRPVYLVFDQFEELYILGSTEEQRTFHSTIAGLLSAGLECKVLLMIREEYIAYLSDLERLIPYLFDNRLRIERMNNRRLREVVTGMARQGEIDIESDEVVTEILARVHDERRGVDLTHLQLYLEHLYQIAKRANERDKTIAFTRELLDRSESLDEVLANHLGTRTRYLREELGRLHRDVSQELPDQVLMALITDEGTKRSMNVDELMEVPKIQRLNASSSAVRFCVEEFERVRLLQRLPFDDPDDESETS